MKYFVLVEHSIDLFYCIYFFLKIKKNDLNTVDYLSKIYAFLLISSTIKRQTCVLSIKTGSFM